MLLLSGKPRDGARSRSMSSTTLHDALAPGGEEFRDPATEARFGAALIESSLGRVRRTLFFTFPLLACFGLLGGLAFGHGMGGVAWKAQAVRLGVLLPAWLVALWYTASLDRAIRSRWTLAAVVPLTILAFTLEGLVRLEDGGGRDVIIIFPVLAYLCTALLVPWRQSTHRFVLLGALVVSPLLVALARPDLGFATIANLWLIWIFVASLMHFLVRQRDRMERALFLQREQFEETVAELQEANERLRAISEQRAQFLAMAAHDLRNPLGVVLGATDLLRHELPTSGAGGYRELAGEILMGAQRMEEIIRHFLEVHANAAQPREPKLERLEASAALAASARRLAPVFARKKQSREGPGTLDTRFLLGDAILLGQALDNLLSNAGKFSTRGSVVRLAVRSGRTPGTIRLEVADEGPGLNADEQVQLFGRYVRLGPQPTGGEPSAGLGLALVKTWVESMSGRVGCQSEPGRGATFWIELPEVD